MTTSPPPNTTRLRFRSFLGAQFTLLLAVCLVLLAIGGGLVYTTYVAPGTESETRTVSSWTVETEHAHSAEVTESNPAFTVGTVLRNRGTYFRSVSPILDVTPQVRYTADEAENVDIELRSVLVVRNVGEEGTVYWEQRESVSSTTATDVAPGDSVTAPFTLNSTAVAERAATIETELGASPGEIETVVLTDTTVRGTLNGENTTYTNTAEFGLSNDGAIYTVANPGIQSDTTEQTVTISVERTYGPLRSLGSLLVLLGGLFGGVGLLYARYIDFPGINDAEQAYLSFRDDRSEFDEWITQIQLPSRVHDRPKAHADSLGDLVELAIDTNTGVVEDPDTGSFHVVADEYVYNYEPPFTPFTPSTPSRAATDDASSGVDVDDHQSTLSDPTTDGPQGDFETTVANEDTDPSTDESPEADGSPNSASRAFRYGTEEDTQPDDRPDTAEEE